MDETRTLRVVIDPKEIQIMSITTETSVENKEARRSAKRLSVYLNDQLAEETLGLELVKRTSSENKGTRLGTFLELLSWELEEDRDSLVRLMGDLGVRRKRFGVMRAGIADKAGRLNLNRHAPMSTMVKLESVDRSIRSELDMWNALRSSVGDRVDGIDFDELILRAERQAEALKRRRLDLAADALSYRGGSAAARSSTPLAVVR
jgi:hypothetical protein